MSPPDGLDLRAKLQRRRAVLCLGGLAALLVWQFALFRMDWPNPYPVKASSGLTYQDRFTYFLYYENLFPVASTRNGRDYGFFFGRDDAGKSEPNLLEYSPEGARRILQVHGSTLVMEWGHTIRSGQLLTAYLYLPDAWRLGSPERAEIRMVHGGLFILAIATLYLMSWWAGRPVFGAILAALIGSSPFQLYAAFREENVFSWPITSFCFLLAAALPLLAGRRTSLAYAIAVAIGCGLFAATASQIRPEPILLLSGVVLALLAARGMRWVVRIALVGLLIGSSAAGVLSWNWYFDTKFEKAESVVRAAGGHVLTGGRDQYHAFWHPIWCGLSDFDTSHGYAWSDAAALAYAQPILEERYAEELPWWWGVKGKEEHGRSAADYVDAAQIYYRVPFQAPHYGLVLRDKVLADVAEDPLWYAGILARRAWRILIETIPPQLTLSTTTIVPLWFPGVLVPPLAVLAYLLRRWAELRMLLFSAAVSLPSLLVFSGRGMTNYSVFHLCAIALLVSAATEGLRHAPASAPSRSETPEISS